MFFTAFKPNRVVSAAEALPGRDTPTFHVDPTHAVLGTSMVGPWPDLSVVYFGMGCFWGAERKLWQQPGVHVTAVGYQGGHTPNPTYQETCSGRTGHTESVRVVFDPTQTSLDALLRVFWESHDPTQGMRQGNDVGTQYRSAVFWTDPAHEAVVLGSRAAYQEQLTAAGFGEITTELGNAGEFWFAEAYHQQYLAKNPGGYCGIGGTGVGCPSGLTT